MMNIRHTPSKLLQRQQRGVALVVSLVVLLLMTIVGLSIMRGNIFSEKSAGNTRDKQRAFHAAQDALLYGEWWLSNAGGDISTKTCSTTSAPTALQVCGYDPGPNTTNISGIQWYTYTPTYMQAQAAGNSNNGGLVTAGSSTSDILYSKYPGIYINCMTCTGVPLSTGQVLYRITAIGYGGVGGTNGTVAIVQSVYAAGAAAPVPTPLNNP